MNKKYLLIILLSLLSLHLSAQDRGNMSFKSPSYVEMYNFSSLTSLQSGTVSFWFKINDLNSPALFFTTSNKLAAVESDELDVKYIPQVHAIQTLVIKSGVISMDAYTPDNSVADNNWHNYTLVSDNAGNIEIYLDGISQTLHPGTCCGGNINDYFFGDLTGLNNMKIGLLQRDVEYSFGDFSMDEFRIWDKALTALEVNSSISSVSTTPVANLVVYYTFELYEDLSVGVAGVNDIRDQTGNAVHGDVVGGIIDQSLSLDPGCYVEIYNYSSIASLQSGTISFWFKLSDLSGEIFFFTATNKMDASNSSELKIKYIPGLHTIQTLVIKSGTITMDAYIPDNSITDNNWHNYTLVSDNSGNIEIYMDGASQTLHAGSCCGGTLADNFLGDISGINNMKIGMLERDIIYTSALFSINDFRIWDKALSGPEIVSSITAASTPPVANLVLYYNFDNIQNLGIGTAGMNDVEDMTGNVQQGDWVCNVVTAVNHAQDQNENLLVYPNPSTDLVNIEVELEGTSVINGKLMDGSGRVLMNWSESANGDYSKQLNLSSLSPGIYFIQLSGDNISKSIKVIKQ